jgi:DNA invertase Pin-like site-specific DNA recombinase
MRKMVQQPNKYVSYLRVSTVRQGQSGLGLEAQRARVHEFLHSLGNGEPIAEYVETESGRKVQRVELQKALAACRAYGATLIIAKLDRLSRNQAFLMSLVDSDVNVRFCDLPEIPAGATGRFMLQQMAAVAELEAGLISERTKAALAARVKTKGPWDRKAAHHLVPGAGQEAATRARQQRARAFAADLGPIIVKARAEGYMSLREIAAYLDREGIKAPRGAEWSPKAVQRVLRYLGQD